LGLLAGVRCGGAVGAGKLKPERLGDYLKVSVSAKEANDARADVLKKRGVDANNFHTATVFGMPRTPPPNEYLREKIGIAALNQIYDKRVPGALWHVRFFRRQRS